MLSQEEMEEYVRSLGEIHHLDPNNYPHAVIEHYFLRHIFCSMPSDFGLQQVDKLYVFLREHSDLKDNMESWSKAIKLTSFQFLIESFFHKLKLSTECAQNLCDFIKVAIQYGEKDKT